MNYWRQNHLTDSIQWQCVWHIEKHCVELRWSAFTKFVDVMHTSILWIYKYFLLTYHIPLSLSFIQWMRITLPIRIHFRINLIEYAILSFWSFSICFKFKRCESPTNHSTTFKPIHFIINSNRRGAGTVLLSHIGSLIYFIFTIHLNGNN